MSLWRLRGREVSHVTFCLPTKMLEYTDDTVWHRASGECRYNLRSSNNSVWAVHWAVLRQTRVYTVKTFWLLQPYFGHLSCMPDVCVTHYKTSKGCFLLNQSLSVVEKLLSHIYRIFLQKAYSYLVTLLPFLLQPGMQLRQPKWLK